MPRPLPRQKYSRGNPHKGKGKHKKTHPWNWQENLQNESEDQKPKDKRPKSAQEATCYMTSETAIVKT